MIKRNIAVLYAVAFLQGMVFYGPIATLYRQARGVSVLEMAAIESVSLVLALVLEVPWGVLADRIGYRRTLLVCNGLFLASKVVFWQAESFGAFLTERILLSVVVAGLSGVDTAMLYRSCGGTDSQRVFGFYESLQTAGLLAAAVVYATAVGERYDLAAGLTAVSYALAAGLTLLLREVEAETSPASGERKCIWELLAMLKRPGVLWFLVGAALLQETHQVITVFLNQLQYDRAGMSAGAMGYAYTAVTVAGLSGMFSARFTQGLGEKRMMYSCCGAAGVACVLLAVTQNAVASVAAVLALRVSFTLLQPLQTEIRNRQVTGADRATMLSVQAVVMSSVGAVVNVAFGAAAERNLPLAFLLGAALCACALPLLCCGTTK